MPKGKKVKKVEAKESIKKAAPKKEEVKKAETPKAVPKDLAIIKAKRDELIKGLSENLLSVTQLKRGGPGIRARHMTETGYSNVVAEINELGKELCLKPIGLGNLRKP